MTQPHIQIIEVKTVTCSNCGSTRAIPMRTAREKHELAVQLLKEVNCPEAIIDALWLFGLTIHEAEIKLRNWNALSQGGVIDGECVELPNAITEGDSL